MSSFAAGDWPTSGLAVLRCRLCSKTTVGTLIGAAAALGAALIALIPFFQTVEFKTYDWRVRHTVANHPTRFPSTI